MQKQVAQAKEAARTKAAPVVADLVADAARATGERLRQGRTVASEAIAPNGHPTTAHEPLRSEQAEHADAWAAATRAPGTPTDRPSAARTIGGRPATPSGRPLEAPGGAPLRAPCGVTGPPGARVLRPVRHRRSGR